MKTKDEEKTREQLIDELAELRKKVAELQKSETERKRAEEALRENEEKYRNLVESISDVVYAIDSSGVLTYISPVVKNTFGYEPDELIGRHFLEFVHKEDHDLLMRRFSELRKGIVRHSDYRVIGKHGDIKWVRTLTNPIIKEGGFVGARGVLIDITERKQAEKEIQSLAKFPSENPNPVLRIARDGTLLYMNEAGLSLLPEWHLQVGQAIDPPMLREVAFQAMDNGSTQVLDLEHGERVYSFFVAPVVDAGYANLYGRNITERKRIEKSLMESERKLRLITENMRDTVFAYDMERRLQYVNPAFETLTGYTCQELYERNFINYIHPEDEARMLQLWEELFQGKEIFNEEFRIVAKDGQIKWCSSSWAPLLDGKGKQVGVQGRETDITERKWAEEALQESKELFEKTFISQPDAIFLLDAINPPTILDCNPAATEVFGYPRQEMVGRTTDFLHVDETALKEFRGHLYPTIADHGFMHLFEFRMKRKDGTVFPTEHSVIRLEDEQGKRIGWVSVVRDITERKRAEERILTYQEHLRSLTSELSLIEERERRRIAIDLHDNISQTLAIAKIKLGMAQGLTSSTDWVGSLNEIGELIDQAIQYTRSLTFELSPPILYELGLEAAVEWLTEQIQEQHGILIDFEDDTQSKPMKDEIRLSLFKATKELLINIVKHAQASKAKVSIWRKDNHIRIRVEDDGVGFSTSEGKQLGKTARFGLFNIRERMKYLGGEIEVESEPGHGTRVTLSAPLEEKED